ncbi:DUF6011 domain-containing protein [Streptomyces sp. NPDC051173]|uniref:DUF6011 domain-containing protein n=1 Tax=Streptomyces sp. NPDC051173 TaxID=3155164 RepID=UPI00344D4C3A
MAARCGLCGRLLADPASRARGLGPVCFRRSRGRTGHRVSPLPVLAAVPETAGQEQLPLVPEQPGLWPA